MKKTKKPKAVWQYVAQKEKDCFQSHNFVAVDVTPRFNGIYSASSIPNPFPADRSPIFKLYCSKCGEVRPL